MVDVKRNQSLSRWGTSDVTPENSASAGFLPARDELALLIVNRLVLEHVSDVKRLLYLPLVRKHCVMHPNAT